jgi:thiosulfate dehydrogenase [quinone] large subunit
MNDVIGFLTISEWLAILRIGIGLWWVKSFLHKPHKEFVSGQMVDWVVSLADNHPFPAFGRLIKRMVVPNASWFPYLILGGELAVGLGMTFGFLTPVAVIAAIFLNLNYILLAGFKPKDISVNKAYQCEQGQNWNMIVAEVVLIFLVSYAGCTWSLDNVFGLFCGV